MANPSLELLDESGYSSQIFVLRTPNSSRICKTFRHLDEAHSLFHTEKEVYERFTLLNAPTTIPKFYGVYQGLVTGLILEYATFGNLHDYIRQKHEDPCNDVSEEMLRGWALQITEALAFAHSVGIYHGDIHPANFLLDAELNVKVADWAAASIDGHCAVDYAYRLRGTLFAPDGDCVYWSEGLSVKTEIFALGSALFTMVSGEEPWDDITSDEEVIERISARRWPVTNDLKALSSVIENCWELQYNTMEEVRNAIYIEMSEGGTT